MNRFWTISLGVLAIAATAYAAVENLGVNGDLFVGDDVTILGDATIKGTLAVTGATTQTGDYAVTGNLAVTGTSTLTGATEVVDDLTVTGSDVTIGAAGVKLTGDGDGAITFLGLGNGSDEALTLNLDDTANTAVISSTTAVSSISTGTIGLDVGATKITGHVTTKGTAPTASAGTIDTKSTDTAGIVKSVGATSLYITFASAYTAEPMCVVSAEEAVVITAKGTTSFTVSAVGNIDDLSFLCMELE